jgi:hypothetical protein
MFFTVSHRFCNAKYEQYDHSDVIRERPFKFYGVCQWVFFQFCRNENNNWLEKDAKNKQSDSAVFNENFLGKLKK